MVPGLWSFQRRSSLLTRDVSRGEKSGHDYLSGPGTSGPKGRDEVDVCPLDSFISPWGRPPSETQTPLFGRLAVEDGSGSDYESGGRVGFTGEGREP